jgi:hypothetical protein
LTALERLAEQDAGLEETMATQAAEKLPQTHAVSIGTTGGPEVGKWSE